MQAAEQVVLSDSDKQGASPNLAAKQAVEAVVNSVLSEAMLNVASPASGAASAGAGIPSGVLQRPQVVDASSARYI